MTGFDPELLAREDDDQVDCDFGSVSHLSNQDTEGKKDSVVKEGYEKSVFYRTDRCAKLCGHYI